MKLKRFVISIFCLICFGFSILINELCILDKGVVYAIENNSMLSHQTESIQSLAVSATNEDYIGFGCNTSQCGDGRENGYSATYLSEGCRNWQLMPLYTPFYRYYIDMDSLYGYSVEFQENFIEIVNNAVAIWNSVIMHDGSGALVNLVETQPDFEYISGSNLCPIRYNPDLVDKLGEFIPVSGLHKIDIKNTSTIRTILHELGHLLGLQDLDMGDDILAHNVLMGYGEDRGYQIHYQDIQGVAVSTGKHTQHSYFRYALDGDSYKHVCFYCDFISEKSSPNEDSVPFVEFANCVYNRSLCIQWLYKHRGHSFAE